MTQMVARLPRAGAAGATSCAETASSATRCFCSHFRAWAADHCRTGSEEHASPRRPRSQITPCDGAHVKMNNAGASLDMGIAWERDGDGGWVTCIVLTVVDEMCFFSISAQRQTSGLTACAEYPFARVCHAAEFRRKGRRSPSSDTARQAAANTERP